MVMLVTGGAGYIGSKLIREIPNHEQFEHKTIRILDNMLREKYFSLIDLPSKAKYEFIEGDITKDDDLEEAFEGVEVVYHLAAITNLAMKGLLRRDVRNINHLGTKKVVDLALKQDIDKLVYTSTAQVYGNTEEPVKEDYPCQPVEIYGETKLLGERECLNAAEERGLDVTVLRFGTIHGFSPGMRLETVVNRFTLSAIIGRPLTIWELARNERRPYLNLNDAVKALIFVASDERTRGEVYNIVKKNASINEVTKTIAKHVPDVRVITTPTPKFYKPRSYQTDGSKIGRLGFQPTNTLEDGIKEVYNKFKHLSPST